MRTRVVVLVAAPLQSESKTTGAAPSHAASRTPSIARAPSSTCFASDARALTMRADYDFAQLMVDHHQAAIDNSEALLQHGRNATTRALAQSIMTDQRQEIAALQNWLTRNR